MGARERSSLFSVSQNVLIPCLATIFTLNSRYLGLLEECVFQKAIRRPEKDGIIVCEIYSISY